jgi:membrane-bound serine protease (ClpP class)
VRRLAGFLFPLLVIFHSTSLIAKDALHLTIQDTINPGIADYVIAGITHAETTDAAYVLIELDTPGGLLNSTRLIVQKILSSRVPVVLFIGPKGAQAGSAGAILTFASDVAVMAPGSNIGAAHPVSGGGEKMDETLAAKVANDTAAFAESLAKTKGRNTEWARKSVLQSASIPADEALKMNVIDLMADDAKDLSQKLKSWKLRTPKRETSQLPSEMAVLLPFPMSIKQRVVSFFANPNLAYLILSLGALCIYVEVTHPGLIFPGALGALCILVSLVSFQMLPIQMGALAMLLGGLALLLAEIFVPSFGALGIGGLLLFVFGSLYLTDSDVPELRISPLLILPTAATLAAVLAGLGFLLFKTRSLRIHTGINDLVGEMAAVKDPIDAKKGKVFLHGELWNAISESGQEIPTGKTVRIKEVRDMCLVVTEKESV